MALSQNPPLITLEEAIKEQLKCVCCKKFMWPSPIRHCIKGHSFCGFCYTACKSTGCNQCGEEFRGDRTHHLEKLFEIVTFNCKYVDIGCEVSLPINDLKKHEPMCVAYWSYCFEPWINSLAKL